MANKVNVRVEAKRLHPNASRYEREVAVTRLLRALKRQCNEVGVMQDYRDHEFFQRKCDLRRRKRQMRLIAARQEFPVVVKEERNRFDG